MPGEFHSWQDRTRDLQQRVGWLDRFRPLPRGLISSLDGASGIPELTSHWKVIFRLIPKHGVVRVGSILCFCS